MGEYLWKSMFVSSILLFASSIVVLFAFDVHLKILLFAYFKSATVPPQWYECTYFPQIIFS